MPNNIKLSIISASLFGIIILLIIIYSNSTGIAEQLTLTPTSSDLAIQRISAEIREYEEILISSTLSAEDERNIRAKLALANSELERRVAVITLSEDVAAIKSTLVADATKNSFVPLSTDDRPLGILENPGHLKGFVDATFTTIWIAPYENTYIKIYAGRLLSDPDQGILVVGLEKSHVFETYLCPQKDGELRIIAFDQDKLVLETKKSTILYFDHVTKTYLDENMHPLAVNTETLIVTPYPAP